LKKHTALKPKLSRAQPKRPNELVETGSAGSFEVTFNLCEAKVLSEAML
jgi:hypothetical protein